MRSPDHPAANVRKRWLAGDPGAAKMGVVENRAPLDQLTARGPAETPEAHGGNGHPRRVIKVEKAFQLRVRVRARGDFENVRAEFLRSPGLFVQAKNRRCLSEIVKRNDAPDVPGARQIEQGKKRRGGAQFDINRVGAGQKTQKQIAAGARGQVVHPAFARMACREDERGGEFRGLYFIEMPNECIEAEFEKIGWPPQADGAPQIPQRKNHAGNSRNGLARRHCLEAVGGAAILPAECVGRLRLDPPAETAAATGAMFGCDLHYDRAFARDISRSDRTQG